MKLNEYVQYDAIGLAHLVKSKQVTPAELLDCAQQAKQKVNGAINAFTTDTDEVAQQQVKNPVTGPLTGVPFPVKDLYNAIEGVVTTNGSRITPRIPAAADSELVKRYRAAGLTFFGMTSSPEFGCTVSTEPVINGPTRNPWNLDHSAGGSSGGAGAAVAAGIAPIANATDGGGSIRIPAQCNGLIGLKPSRARVPKGPDSLEGWQGQSIGHIVSRTIRDTALVLDCTAGDEVGAPYSAPAAPQGGYLQCCDQSPGKLKIAFSNKSHVPVHDDVQNAVHEVVEILNRFGHSISEDTAVIDPVDAGKALLTVISSNLDYDISNFEKKLGITANHDHIENVLLMYRERASTYTAADLIDAIRINQRIGQIWGEFHQNYDVFVCPVLAQPSAPIGMFFLDTDDFVSYGKNIAEYTPFTGQFNQSGQPSISLPTGMSSTGLPIGVMFTAALGREDILIKLAAQLEREIEWNHGQKPNIWAGNN